MPKRSESEVSRAQPCTNATCALLPSHRLDNPGCTTFVQPRCNDAQCKGSARPHVVGDPRCTATRLFSTKGRRAMTRTKEERGGGRRNASRVKAVKHGDQDIAARARAYLEGKAEAGFGFGEPGYEPRNNDAPHELTTLKAAVREYLTAQQQLINHGGARREKRAARALAVLEKQVKS